MPSNSKRSTATCRRRARERSSAACSDLETQGADKFFGEPALDLNDLIQTDSNGRGVVNILAAEKLMQQSPKVYATFLLWLLSELFETPAGNRRSGKTEAGFLLRRSAPALRRHRDSIRRENGADGPADPIERGRRLLRQPESARYSGCRARPVGQPGAACLARLHAARSKGGAGGGDRRSGRIPRSR